MIERVLIAAVIATIPLVFGAVQPVVWSVYAGLMTCCFLVAWWRDPVDFGFMRSPLALWSVGVFLVFTLVQVVPLPEGLLGRLSPFRFAVVSRAAALLGEGAAGHALGYVAPAAFAWWVFLLSLVLFFVVLRAHLTQTRHLAAVVGVMLGVALLLALYGLIQVLIPTMGVLWAGTEAYLGYARGTFINRNHFAGFIEMVWPLGLGWLLAMAHVSRRERSGHKGGVKRWKHLLSSDRTGLQLFVWAALVFILLALLFSKSRAGIAGALIGFAAFIVLVRLGGKRFSKPAWAGIGLGCGVLLFYGYVIGFEEVIGRFLMIDAQVGARAPIWIGTIAMIGDHPLGVGLANYEDVIPVFNALGPYGIKYTHAHNDYLQLLAEAGWPGFIALAGGFYLFVGRCIRRLRKFGPDMDPVRFYIGIGACSGLISIAFHSLFDFNLQIPANLLYFVVLLGIASACFRRSPERVLNGSPLERPEKAAAASNNGKPWRFLKKATATVILLALTMWVVRYGMLWRAVENRDFLVDRSGPGDMRYFPQAWFGYGLEAWYANRLDPAADDFRKAVSINVLHVDAWIKLAQVEAARGHAGAAAGMLQFTDGLTRDVVRWKWPQLLLARDLGREDIFAANINFVIPHYQFREDALQLLDMHLGRDTASVMKVLAAHNLPDYLRWLMKWNRLEDSFQVWAALFEKGNVDAQLYEGYVNFLIAHNALRRAAGIRAQYTGGMGMSNPGFEAPLSGDPFGWRVHPGGRWDVRRVRSGAKEGDHALQVTFSGEENVDGGLLGQLLTVPPGSTGELSFWWQSTDLTTDKRPFVEIRSLEGRDLQWRSEMVPPNTQWRQEKIVFELPEECHAVRVALRREQSHRFDNQIKGVLRLDDFRWEARPRTQQ